MPQTRSLKEDQNGTRTILLVIVVKGYLKGHTLVLELTIRYSELAILKKAMGPSQNPRKNTYTRRCHVLTARPSADYYDQISVCRLCQTKLAATHSVLCLWLISSRV